MTDFTTLSIVIPVYNEVATITEVLNRIRATQLMGGIQKEVVIIDDCSMDGTSDKILAYQKAHSDLHIRYFRHKVNQGKGAAMHTAIRELTGQFFVIQDADLEYDPREYNTLLKPILDEGVDVVIGAREGYDDRSRYPYYSHFVANRFLTKLFNTLNPAVLNDLQTCSKMFRSSLVKDIPLVEKRFGFDPEVTSKVLRKPNVRLAQVVVSYQGRTQEEGKKLTWKDGFRAVYCIVRYNLLS